MFSLKGNIVVIPLYEVTYTHTKEILPEDADGEITTAQVTETMDCFTQTQMNHLTTYFNKNEMEFSVTEISQTDYEWFAGLSFDTYEEALTVFEAGQAAYEIPIQIEALKQSLKDTDYKVIKCAECNVLGTTLPYDIEELHAERQAIRDQINALQEELTENES